MEKNEWIRERETIKMSAVSWAVSGSIGRRAGVAPVTGASSTAPAKTGKNLRMKAARVAADLSQADLAAAVGATRQTIGVQAPMATAIADVAEARRDYMDESGGRYVQVIADGGMGDSGSFVKALALGADAVMLGAPLARATEAPGKGTHWGSEARHQTLPRGYRTTVGTVGPLEQVLFGPSHQADGKTNFIGALKRAMASTGYVDVKNFQRCGMVVNPYSAR